MNADVIGAGVKTADPGNKLPALPGPEGKLPAVLNLVEGASVAVDVKAHGVDGEKAGVLYFDTVPVVFASDRPVDLDFLINTQKNKIGEDVQRGEGKQQKHGVEPCEGGRTSIKAGKDEAPCQYCKIQNYAP